MEPDVLKSVWQDMKPKPKANTELYSMMQEGRHPVLKRIRTQLIIEILVFSFFLFIYYDFFDGDHKPVYANILLVTAVLLVIMHNIIGYRLTRNSVKGNDLKQSLDHHLSKMKLYATVSVASRMMWALCLLVFFSSVIEFDAKKYWILAVAMGVFVVQLAILSAIWMGRIRRLKGTIGSLFL